MSFSGIDGKARYQSTSLRDALPVRMVDGDDRVEAPQGAKVSILDAGHEFLHGLPQNATWPEFLGYNKLIAKPESTVVATLDDDPFLVAGTYGDGRTAAFSSDCGPHWGPPSFVEWDHYGHLWANIIGWLANRRFEGR